MKSGFEIRGFTPWQRLPRVNSRKSGPPPDRAGSGSFVRRGIASLEFVLAFPLLLAVAAIIFGVGSAGVRKSQVAITARHDAWQRRAGAHAPTPLVLNPGLKDGKIYAPATQSISLPTGFTQGSVTAESQNHLLAAPWDYLDVKFADNTPDFTPHTEPLTAILQNAIPGLPSSALSIVTSLGQMFGQITSVAGPISGMTSQVVNTAVRVAGIALVPFGFYNLYQATQD